MSRVRIKNGDFEFEYEGSDEFIKSDMEPLIGRALELLKAAPQRQIVAHKDLDENSRPLQLSTATIAARIHISTGNDLALAAAAHLTLVKNMESFSRKELLDEMKTAKSYYKLTYSKNFTAILGALVADKKLNEPSTGIYAMTLAEQERMGNELSQ